MLFLLSSSDIRHAKANTNDDKEWEIDKLYIYIWDWIASIAIEICQKESWTVWNAVFLVKHKAKVAFQTNSLINFVAYSTTRVTSLTFHILHICDKASWAGINTVWSIKEHITLRLVTLCANLRTSRALKTWIFACMTNSITWSIEVWAFSQARIVMKEWQERVLLTSSTEICSAFTS